MGAVPLPGGEALRLSKPVLSPDEGGRGGSLLGRWVTQ